MPTPANLNLRILTLNIQVGLQSSQYHHYVTGAWRHLVPTRGATANLARIAALAAPYDFVALQEADAGSLRTGKLNQVAHLAQLGNFPYWNAAVTRDLRPFAQHCLGCLSRWPLQHVQYHALPGRLPGRGALEVIIQPAGYEPLRLIMVHLALSARVRIPQLQYLAELVSGYAADTDTLVLGDFNSDNRELSAHGGIQAAGLHSLHSTPTFPSWAAVRTLDHVLASPTVDVHSTTVLDERLSDHLPVATEIRLRLAKV